MVVVTVAVRMHTLAHKLWIQAKVRMSSAQIQEQERTICQGMEVLLISQPAYFNSGNRPLAGKLKSQDMKSPEKDIGCWSFLKQQELALITR